MATPSAQQSNALLAALQEQLLRLRVLIVDRQPNARNTLRTMLSTLGVTQVHGASSAWEALRQVAKHEFGVIFSDYVLEDGRDGQQLLEELRHRHLIPLSTVFMIVTAERGYQHVASVAELTPDDYLIKPFTAEQLQGRLARALFKKKIFASANAALEKGAIDATEWVGPYDDEKLGFYKVAKYYYAPGWWEPSAQVTLVVNAKEWEKLPKSYQYALDVACAEANMHMLAEYDAKNPLALAKLLKAGVQLKRFSNEIMVAAQKAAFDFYNEEAGRNPTFKKIYSEWEKFRRNEQAWFSVNDAAIEQFMYSHNK